MRAYKLDHLSDSTLLHDLRALVARDRATTADLLAHIAEVDERRLYAPAGYPSMYEYCVRELRFSEDAACTRIQVARTARQFPAIFATLAGGRLHLSAVRLLAPHLAPDNADDLLAAATHKTKSEIEQLLAQRFPSPDLPTWVQALPALTTPKPVPGRIDSPEVVGALTEQLAPGPVGAPAPRPKLTPLSAERVALQFTIDKPTHDRLVYAQSLVSHSIPSGDLAQVFARALEAWIPQLERKKFGATCEPRPGRSASARSRHIPAHVRHAVWGRDQGQCTFVSESGHRCEARKFLQFDHVDPVARGGEATVSRMRLRCRTHNQYEAERVFGAGFISEKREQARRAALERRTRAADARARADTAREHARAAAEQARASAVEEPHARADVARAQLAADEQTTDLTSGLRSLGFRTEDARRAVEASATLQSATLEERMRAALTFLRPKARTIPAVVAASP